MDAIQDDMRYFQRRLDATRAMADAAAEPCARNAHDHLAHLYGETLAALSVQAAGLIAAPVLTGVARGTRDDPRPLRPMPHRARLTLKLAC